MNKFLIPILCLWFLSCVPEETDENNNDDVSEVTATELYDSLSCTLSTIYGETPLSKKRVRTLKLIADKMSAGFEKFDLSTNVEKAHYISQLTHESDGFSATVERVLGPTWRELFRGESETWNCPQYLDAVNEDDNYFNERYVYSRNSYKSKFRGRGLIQLTGCFNYLGFYYHLSAKENNHPDSDLHRTYFTYQDERGDTIQVGMYCSDDALERMDGEFSKKGLAISPQSLLNSFEETSDELALPCSDRGTPELSSTDFIVDSSFWYWKKCQNSSYTKDFRNQNSDQAVARMTECIHGRHSTYQNYQQINCERTGGDFRKESYCRRKKAYEIALTCLQQ